MKNEFDMVYDKHCSGCPLRHRQPCKYEKCSEEQYEKWLNEERHKITDDFYDGNFG